jgi:hypothetical protein
VLVSWNSLTKRAGSGSVNQMYESKDPDPYQNVTDPEHCRFTIDIYFIHAGEKVPKGFEQSVVVGTLLSLFHKQRQDQTSSSR